MVFKHSCTIISAVSAVPPMGPCFWPKTATFLCGCTFRLHENDKKHNKNTKTKRLSKVETLKTFSSLPFPFQRVNRENATKTHTCFSK